MADIRHFLNGKEVYPADFMAKIVMDWVGKNEPANINIGSIRLVGEDGKLLRDRILSGLNGGVGFYEGEPYSVQIGEDGQTYTFDGYLDFSQGVQFTSQPMPGTYEVECPLVRKQGTDWLNEVADGFSFRYLESIGIIKNSDFVGVPYVINYIPDGAQLLILALSTFVLTKELIENIKALSDRISDLTDAATPVVGVSAGLGAGVVTAYDIGNIIMAALKLIAQIAYLVAIVIAIVELVEQIIEQLMPPKRFHLGTPIRVLFQRACDYLGMKFSSTLLDALDKSGNKWVLIPNKGHRGGEKPTGADNSWRETGVPSANSPVDTFGGLIRTFKNIFNADFEIKDGTFIFERKDFFERSTGYVIPDTFTNQDKLVDLNGFNSDEIKANYNINWSFDSQDLNTLDNQEGRVFQAVLEPKVTNNAELRTLKGLEQVDIPFTMAVRKDKLTVIEEVVKVLVSAADALTGQLGNPQSLSGKISARIGAMHISSHFLSVPKMVVMSGSNLALNQRSLMSAQSLWDNYHFLNSFKEINGKHSQYWLYSEQKIPFCFSDFMKLLSSNQVETAQGEVAEIETLDWDVWNNFATISYRVNRLYDDNFKIKYL